jgi:SLT domain-containing protein
MGAQTFDYDNGGLNPRPSGNQPGQLYYDYDTGQQYYMGYEGMNPNDPTNGLKLLGQMLKTGQKATPQKIFVNGAGRTTPMNDMIARAQQAATQTSTPSIEQLFPQLTQSQYLAPAQTQTAQTATPSYGAGRFLSSK